MFDQDYTVRRRYGGPGTMGLFVSLYLIMLTFFIMLEAASTKVQDKTLSAFASVNSVFGNAAIAGRREKGLDHGAVVTKDERPLQKARLNLLKDFGVESRYTEGTAPVLEMRVNSDQLFALGETVPFLSDQGLLLKLMNLKAEMDGSAPADMIYQLSFYIEANSPGEKSFAFLRAIGLSDVLAKEFPDVANITVGLSEVSSSQAGYAGRGPGATASDDTSDDIGISFKAALRQDMLVPLKLWEAN